MTAHPQDRLEAKVASVAAKLQAERSRRPVHMRIQSGGRAVLQTATGAVTASSAAVLIAPPSFAWLRLRELQYRGRGGSRNACTLTECSLRSIASAILDYRFATGVTLGYFHALSDERRAAVFSDLLAYVQSTRSLAGLQGIFLTALEAVADAGRADLTNPGIALWNKLAAGSANAWEVSMLDVATRTLYRFDGKSLGHLQLGAAGSSLGDSPRDNPVRVGLQGRWSIGLPFESSSPGGSSTSPKSIDSAAATEGPTLDIACNPILGSVTGTFKGPGGDMIFGASLGVAVGAIIGAEIGSGTAGAGASVGAADGVGTVHGGLLRIMTEIGCAIVIGIFTDLKEPALFAELSDYFREVVEDPDGGQVATTGTSSSGAPREEAAPTEPSPPGDPNPDNPDGTPDPMSDAGEAHLSAANVKLLVDSIAAFQGPASDTSEKDGKAPYDAVSVRVQVRVVNSGATDPSSEDDAAGGLKRPPYVAIVQQSPASDRPTDTSDKSSPWNDPSLMPPIHIGNDPAGRAGVFGRGNFYLSGPGMGSLVARAPGGGSVLLGLTRAANSSRTTPAR